MASTRSRGLVVLSSVGAAGSQEAPLPAAAMVTRVLAQRALTSEPVSVRAIDGAAVVTFAESAERGRALVVDAATLDVCASGVLAVASRPADRACSARAARPAYVRLRGGGSLKCWTDGRGGAVFVQVRAAGTDHPVGAPGRLTPPGAFALGNPHAAIVDGVRVVVVYFLRGDAGFQLVATALDIWPGGRVASTGGAPATEW